MDGLCIGVWQVLGSSVLCVLEWVYFCIYIAWRWKLDCAFFIVPLQCYPKVFKHIGCSFECCHMVDSLDAWTGIILVWTVSFNTDVTLYNLPPLVSHGVALLVYPLFSSIIIFGNFSFLGVTVKFLILIDWKNDRFFCWVHWLDFLCVCLYNSHPQRLFIGGWCCLGYTLSSDLSWFTSLGVSWTNSLTGTLRGIVWGLALLNISARFLNDSMCSFISLTIGLAGAGFWIA